MVLFGEFWSYFPFWANSAYDREMKTIDIFLHPIQLDYDLDYDLDYFTGGFVERSRDFIKTSLQFSKISVRIVTNG